MDEASDVRVLLEQVEIIQLVIVAPTGPDRVMSVYILLVVHISWIRESACSIFHDFTTCESDVHLLTEFLLNIMLVHIGQASCQIY